MDKVKQPESVPDNTFQDSVLLLVEARSDRIIEQASEAQHTELQKTRENCEKIDFELIKEHLHQDTGKKVAAYAQDARRELLETRTQLVDEMFTRVEQNLAAFTGGAAYPAYLMGLLDKHPQTSGAKDLVIYLRRQDQTFRDAILKKCPNARVELSGRIRLGGLLLESGKVLFDETIDQALEEEKEKFYASGKLSFQ